MKHTVCDYCGKTADPPIDWFHIKRTSYGPTARKFIEDVLTEDLCSEECVIKFFARKIDRHRAHMKELDDSIQRATDGPLTTEIKQMFQDGVEDALKILKTGTPYKPEKA